MPGSRICLVDYLSTHPVGEATRVSLYDNTFTVAKLHSITNSLGYKKQKTTGGAINKWRKLVVSANEHQIRASTRNFQPEEGGKTRDHRVANQNAVTGIIEFNDRKGANIVKSITEGQLRESAINFFTTNKIHFQNNNNSTMKSFNLKKLNKLLLRHPEITSGSSSEVEVVDATLEAVKTSIRDDKCITVISIPSAFRGGGVVPGGIPWKPDHVRNYQRLQN